MAEHIGWGILGTGRIAAKFADDLRHVPEAVLTAVGSRSAGTAETFGQRFAIPHRYASYEALVNDPDVDVVYVSTPHGLHAENTRLALEAGKAVLCEKPFTLNARQANEIITLSRQRGLFLMEAMWTRFLPAIVDLRRMLADGLLGEVRLLAADFGLAFAAEHGRWLFTPDLGGGALLDLGVYPISLASMVFGPPASIVGLAAMGETGVDEQAGIVFRYPQGQIACLYAASRVTTPTEATLVGTRGRLRVHAPMFRPECMTLFFADQEDRQVNGQIQGIGLHYQVTEVMRSLAAGKLESGIMPLDESLAIMETLDSIRAQWGLRYPGE